MAVEEAPEQILVDESTTPHWVVLAACLAILLGALILTPSNGELRLGGFTLPGLCTLRVTTGIPCPGCGLTRSLVAAVRGDWSSSAAFHRLGPIVLVYLILQATYRAVWIGVPPSRRVSRLPGRLLDLSLIPLMVLFLVNWIPTLMSLVGS
jgi:hypothetical protein